MLVRACTAGRETEKLGFGFGFGFGLRREYTFKLFLPILLYCGRPELTIRNDIARVRVRAWATWPNAQMSLFPHCRTQNASAWFRFVLRVSYKYRPASRAPVLHTALAFMDFLSKIVSAISDALRDGEKLPGALMLCGILKTAAALYLIFFRVPGPGGVFLHHHDKALICLYYGILIAVVIFGSWRRPPASGCQATWSAGAPSGRRFCGFPSCH